jgi:alkylation response protein AidB-like acyl-CoA dehydrogenase
MRRCRASSRSTRSARRARRRSGSPPRRHGSARCTTPGWAGITWPRAHGGRGATIVEQLIFGEECAAAGAPDSINLAVALGLTGPTLMHCGTPQQQAHFLPRILRGDDIWCQGFSEPNAGSDLAGLRTRGVVDGDTIAVTGQKIWTSFAQYADWCILVVRTDPTAGKHRGMTFLLVDMQSPGITIRPLVEMTGEAWFNEVFFDDVKVPRANVVGEIDKGWDVVITTLAHERGGATPHARLRRELHGVLGLARARQRDGRPAAEDARVRQQMAQLAVEVQIAKLTAYRNVTVIQRTGKPGAEGSILKLFWSELEQRLMDAACGLLGPYASSPRRSPRRRRDRVDTRAVVDAFRDDLCRHLRGAAQHHRPARAGTTESEESHHTEDTERTSSIRSDSPLPPCSPVKALR